MALLFCILEFLKYTKLEKTPSKTLIPFRVAKNVEKLPKGPTNICFLIFKDHALNYHFSSTHYVNLAIQLKFCMTLPIYQQLPTLLTKKILKVKNYYFRAFCNILKDIKRCLGTSFQKVLLKSEYKYFV